MVIGEMIGGDMLGWLRKRREARENLARIHTPIDGQWDVEIEGHGCIRMQALGDVGIYVTLAYMMLIKANTGIFNNMANNLTIITLDHVQRKIKAIVVNDYES